MPFRLLRAHDGYYVENIHTKHKYSSEPMSLEKAEAQMRILNNVMNKEEAHVHARHHSDTHREHVLKKLGLDMDKHHSLDELSKASGVKKHILQEVYNRGTGAYKTNPQSVRMIGTYKKGVDAPMSQKLSKEQWSMARVYSFLDGNPKHDTDLRDDPPHHHDPHKFVQEVVAHMKKGTLTREATKHHETPLEFSEDILAHPDKYSLKMRRKAQFLQNIQRKKD